MKKSNINEILKLLMLKKNIKTAELARKIKVPQQTLQRIVSGVSPRPHSSTLKLIAAYFEISIEQLKGEKELPEASLPTLNFAGNIKNRIIEIPLLTWNKLKDLENNTSETTENTITISMDINKSSFGLIMNDSSMDPYFSKDSILIIDPEKDYKDRSFVLVRIVEGNIYIFRQILIDGQYKYLKPVNPDLNSFKMRLLGENDRIIGTLVEARRMYDNI